MSPNFRHAVVSLLFLAALPCVAVAQQGNDAPFPGAGSGQNKDDKDRSGYQLSVPHVHVPIHSSSSSGEKVPTGAAKEPIYEPKFTPPPAEPWTPPRMSTLPNSSIYEPRFTPPPRMPTVEPHFTIPEGSFSSASHVPVPRGGFGWIGGIGSGIAGGIGAIFRGLFGRKKT